MSIFAGPIEKAVQEVIKERIQVAEETFKREQKQAYEDYLTRLELVKASIVTEVVG